ncbi:MAG: dodecin domain-containing protein [Actinomycetota bacterium]
MSDEMPGAVVKVIELVSSSPSSFSDAVRNAVKVASKTIRDCKIAFIVEAGVGE